MVIALKRAGTDRKRTIDIENEAYQGEVRLEIKPFESFRQIDRFARYLSQVKNVSIISEIWTEDEGYNIMFSADAPLALGRVLRSMPEVVEVGYNGYEKGLQKLVVNVKTAQMTPPCAITQPVLV